MNIILRSKNKFKKEIKLSLERSEKMGNIISKLSKTGESSQEDMDFIVKNSKILEEEIWRINGISIQWKLPEYTVSNILSNFPILLGNRMVNDRDLTDVVLKSIGQHIGLIEEIFNNKSFFKRRYRHYKSVNSRHILRKVVDKLIELTKAIGSITDVRIK